MRNKWKILLLAPFLLSGCEMAAEVGEMHSKMEKVNDALKTELKMEAQVGWNIHNGTLTQISVLIPAEKAGEQTLQELKESTYPIVRKHFQKDPLVYQLAVSFPIEQ
ncbi:MAG: hypothetical protein RPU43_00550 [Candidatus Sedimenticola sp. (ex Thyasira tokunagai)]